MKLRKKSWRIFLFCAVLILALILAFFLLRNSKIFPFANNKNDRAKLNTNVSPELEKLKDNTIIYLLLKDSFILPRDYKMDSQFVDRSIIIFPKDQKMIVYSGVKSLESFGGIFITSANTVANASAFKETNEKQFSAFMKANPSSDAKGKFIKDSEGVDKYVIAQSRPFKMIETILNRGQIIEIVSAEENEAYKQIVSTYRHSLLIAENDRKEIYKLQKELVEAYEKQDFQKIFSMLSPEAQEKNNLGTIEKSAKNNLFKDLISIEPTTLYHLSGNFVLQSRVLFEDNYMKRLDISFKVDYDGKKNNWLIDSFTIKDKEKYIRAVETK